jgi:hypothetical protein
MAMTAHEEIALQVCPKCGVLRIDPADAGRILRAEAAP